MAADALFQGSKIAGFPGGWSRQRQKLHRTSTEETYDSAPHAMRNFLISQALTRKMNIPPVLVHFVPLRVTPVQIELEDTQCDFGHHSA
jgi:hypothetical protein